MSPTFRSFEQYNFRLWFFGAVVSNIGTWMQSTAQSWVVLTELTKNNAAAVGFTMALQFGPPLLLVTATGWVADRFDRRRILICTQTAQAVLAFGLGALLLAGHAQLWQLYVFALLLGIVNAFDTPTRQAFVNELVPNSHVSNAVALNSASFNAARLVGPAVAGLLLAVTSSGWVFMINGISFIAVIGALVLVRGHELHRTSHSGRAVKMSAGFRYVAARGDLLVGMVIVFLLGAFGMNFPIFASTMAVEFGVGASGYGLLSSMMAIGSLAGALLSARREQARLRVVILGTLAFTIAATGLAFAPSYAIFALIAIVMGFSVVTILTTANGYVQTTTAPEVRGRVMAIYMALVAGGTPIGAPIAGWVANTFGPRWAIGVAAAAGLLAFGIGVGWFVLVRGLRLQRHPQRRWALSVSTTARRDALAAGFVAPPTSPVSVVTENIELPRSS